MMGSSKNKKNSKKNTWKFLQFAYFYKQISMIGPSKNKRNEKKKHGEVFALCLFWHFYLDQCPIEGMSIDFFAFLKYAKRKNFRSFCLNFAYFDVHNFR